MGTADTALPLMRATSARNWASRMGKATLKMQPLIQHRTGSQGGHYGHYNLGEEPYYCLPSSTSAT
jgi:hypothetical protein